MDSFFTTGWERDLAETDITAPQTKAHSALLCERLEAEWKKELKKVKPSLIKSIMKVFIPELLLKHAVSIWMSEFLRFFQCFVMKWLISSFTQGDYNMAYIWALLFGSHGLTS